MTAPLPPPDVTRLLDSQGNWYECEPLYEAETVKLAVREALERAEDAVDSLHPKCSPAECAAAIRAMLEDYK